jgi:hypothetical protein
MSQTNCRRSNRTVKQSSSSTKQSVDVASDDETTDINPIKTRPAPEAANLTLHSETLQKRKRVLEIGESEMVLKLNQKILECIERNERDKAEEYREFLKECLASFSQSFSQSKRHQSDLLPELTELANHSSSSIDAHTSRLETCIPPKDQVKRPPVAEKNVTDLEAQSQPSEKKKLKVWTRREEWMLVVGEQKVRNLGRSMFNPIKEMFKPELDRFTNKEFKSKLHRLKNHNPNLYNTLVKAKQFEDIFLD